MEKYIKTIEDGKIIFKNLSDNTELTVKHYNDECIYDTIFINKDYDLDFIEYIVQNLKKTKDIGTLFVEYDSQDFEKMLYRNGLRVSNYQYTIDKSKHTLNNNYEVSNILDDDGKTFYLKMINAFSKENSKYFNHNDEYQEYGEKWFKIEDYEYRIYRKNGKIIGMVDYKNFDNNQENEENINNVFDCNNKLCIRCLFSEDDEVLEYMLKDLLNHYKKDIKIHITYNEKCLKKVVNNLNGKFNYCQYVLIENPDNI